jgi:ABC-type lipoprotein release transport system permease subunit
VGTFVRQGTLVVRIALRNLVSHRSRSALVGSILVLGTALVLVGVSLLSSIEGSMEASITQSMAGQLQVYSSEGRDDLSLFGGGFMGQDDIGRVDRIDQVARVLRPVEGVKAVVPMGIDFATITQAGELESTLADLRAAVYRARQSVDRDGGFDGADSIGSDDGVDDSEERMVRELASRVRQLVTKVADELERRLAVSSDPEALRESVAQVRRASTDDFWARFENAPLEQLEYLDTRVAPQTTEGRIIYFRYLGTDVDQFVEHFDRFDLVKGERIPSGHRGLMFNQKFYEREIKHDVARSLDRIHRGIVEQELRIDTDPLLGTLARRVPSQYRRITYQLDAGEAAKLADELRAYLELGPEGSPSLDELVKEFLSVDDETFMDRYEAFYDLVAPKIDLYKLDVSDTVTIRTFTRSGFLKALNVKLYGVFRFKGLEGSDLAGSHNLMDLVTFRELYGLMTPAKARELDRIRDEVGVQDVSRESAERALFGESDELVDPVGPDEAVGGFDEFEGIDFSELRGRSEQVFDARFSREDLETGMALNLAVVLEDDAEAAAVQQRLRKAVDGAGLGLKVVTWQEAAGLIGQFVTVIRFVLYIALFVIFSVALVIINNSTVTATLERIPEIGTMRAIGAGRGVVLGLVVVESLALSLVAGALGAAIGAGVLAVLSETGIPAWHPVVVFLFGGPRLYPSFGAEQVVGAVGAVAAVSLVSALYPARIASRVQPVEAMRDRD